jgi:hypothetical protein
MLNAPGKSSVMRRHLHLSAALSFLLFLIASEPHRVHHFFEQFPNPGTSTAHADEHSDGAQHSHDKDQDRSRSQQNDCVVLSVAQHAHASLV